MMRTRLPKRPCTCPKHSSVRATLQTGSSIPAVPHR
jgi:hypothetical protein